MARFGAMGDRGPARPTAAARLARQSAWVLAGSFLALTGSSLAWVGTSRGSRAAEPTTVTFHYDGLAGFDGTPQFWVVPAKVHTARFRVFASQGGSFRGANGGRGGEVDATLAVSPGERLEINVGGMPSSTSFRSGGGPGGWNGGGAGGQPRHGVASGGGSGGGASDVRRSPYGLSERLLVAGGGGGAGGHGTSALGNPTGGAGGAGGGMAGKGGGGVDCWDAILKEHPGQGGGGGATASGGGGGGDNCGIDGKAGGRASGGGGARGQVYDCCLDNHPVKPPLVAGGGGGGGGGFYGGGGGGGGEAFTEPGGSGPNGTNLLIATNAAGGGGGSGFGPSAAVFRTGVHEGSGLVTVTYTPSNNGGPKPPTTTKTTPTTATTTHTSVPSTTAPPTSASTTVTVTAGLPGTYTFRLSTSTQPRVISDLPVTELTIPAGEVTFEVTNSPSAIVSHTFEVCTTRLAKPVVSLTGVQALPNRCSGQVTPLLAPGATATLTIDLATPGAYEYLSTANNPEGDAFSGMKGVLNVT